MRCIYYSCNCTSIYFLKLNLWNKFFELTSNLVLSKYAFPYFFTKKKLLLSLILIKKKKLLLFVFSLLWHNGVGDAKFLILLNFTTFLYCRAYIFLTKYMNDKEWLRYSTISVLSKLSSYLHFGHFLVQYGI